MKKYIILVAGYEYKNGGTDFATIADQRRKYILQKNPSWQNDPGVLFVRLDVRRGTIEQNIYKGNRRNWTLQTSLEAINRRQHYSSTNFRQQDTRVISIADVYKYIVNIGETEPGTVEELTILGHGWQGGPILVNSFQRDEYANGANSRLRDPWDKDGRTKDFLADNMNDPDWTRFKKAFTNPGFIWIWGCVFSRAYYNTLYLVMRSSEFRAKRFGEHSDSDTFTITASQSFVEKYYDVDRSFFPGSNNERTFRRSLAEIKRFLKRGLINSYATRVTADTGIECRSGYLGTYSTFERSYSGHYETNRVMVIPRNSSIYGDNFTTTINFYKYYLNIPEDPENRGYARLIGTQVNEWFKSL